MSDDSTEIVEKPRKRNVPKRTHAEFKRRYELIAEACPPSYEQYCVLDGLRVTIDEVMLCPHESLASIRCGIPEARAQINEEYLIIKADQEEEKGPMVEAMRLMNAQAEKAVRLTGTCLDLCEKLVAMSGKLAKTATKSNRKAVKAEKKAMLAEDETGLSGIAGEVAAIMGPEKFAAFMSSLVSGPKKEEPKPKRKAKPKKRSSAK